MADVAEPGVCSACGRQLPSQQGRGRIRRYCDASCRDAARRARERQPRPGRQRVKEDLTGAERHHYLDGIDKASGADDAVAVKVTAAAHRLAEELGQPGSARDAVVAARELSALAEAALQTAVDRARAAGQSWREIGDVLGTSRQAAFQRFGHPVDPRTGQPISRAVPPQWVTEFLADFIAGHWDEVLGYCSDAVREKLDVQRLARGWAQMIGMFGSYQSMGEVIPVPAGDGTAVDVLLHFEAGEAMLWVCSGADGKVIGLRLHPPSR
jgi:hypothetical protein